MFGRFSSLSTKELIQDGLSVFQKTLQDNTLSFVTSLKKLAFSVIEMHLIFGFFVGNKVFPRGPFDIAVSF